MRTLLDEIEWGDDEKAQQDRLIVEVLYGTGIRLSELINLRVEDIHDEAVKVTGKGNKTRMIPLNTTLRHMIARHIKKESASRKIQPGSYLFVTKQGKQLYPMYVYRVVNNALMQVSSISSRSPHKIRHAFATHLLNKGADLNAVKALLGHESLAATQVYTHNSVEKLKAVYKNAHPKANKHES